MKIRHTRLSVVFARYQRIVTAFGLATLGLFGLYASGKILNSGTYLFDNPWATVLVFFCFWLPAFLIIEYVLLLFVPLKWSVKKARALLLGVEMFSAFGTLLYMRFVWTAETLIGTPWIVAPQLEQLFFAASVTAIIARIIFFQSSERDSKLTIEQLDMLTDDAEQSADSGHHLSITKQTQQFFLHGIILIAVLIFGWTQATHHLNGEDFDLQNDDFLQYGAAVGYLRTGEFVDWDFTKNEVQKDAGGSPVVYDRAWIGTWQIAQSMQLFGENEFAARLPAVLWFLIFLIIVYITAFVWTRSFLFAALAALSPIFFDGVMLHARMVRMYSPLLTIGTGIIISFWYMYVNAIAGKVIRTIAFAILTAALFGFGWLHHELILILAPGMILFIAYEWIRYIFVSIMHTSHESTQTAIVVRAQMMRTFFLVSLCVGALVLWGVNEYLNSAIFTLGHLGLRKTLNVEYQFLVFMDFALPLTLMTVYLISVIFALLHPRASVKERYLAVLSLTVMCILLLVVKRYKAYRYIQFLLPVVWGFLLLIWWRWLEGVVRFALRNAKSQAHRFIPAFAGITFFVIFVPLGFAGVAAHQPFITVHESNRLYEVDHGFDTQAAYQFIRTHKTAKEPVFALSFRDQYWKNDPALQLVTIKRRNTYNFEELQKDLSVYRGVPVWFVWEGAKDHEIPEGVKRTITQHAQNLATCLPELRGSGMHVYYWGDRDIPCDSASAHQSQVWSEGNTVITHALGNIGSDIRTNSKEALRQSLEEGDKVLEADFVVTKDKRLVVKHDWLVNSKNGKAPVERPQRYADFMNSRIDGKYTPLDAHQLLTILTKHPDVSLVIDAKGKDYAEILRLLQTEIYAVDSRLFQQIILQTYHPEDVVVAKRFSDQSHILFTMYRTTMNNDEVLQFVKKEQISVVTIPKERVSESFAQALNAIGVRLYAHTVNSKEQAQELQRKGVYGVYSDTLTVKDLPAKK